MKKAKSKKSLRLDEDILEKWGSTYADTARVKQAVGDFRSLLNLRHWLAHGRDWSPRLGKTYAPQSVYDIAKQMSNLVIEMSARK